MKYLIVLLLSLILIPHSNAAPRTALVIGNSDYKLMPLANPENDAEDISRKLKTLGFEVIFKTNQDQSETKQLIREFSKKLKQKGGVGLFFYAGHGLQIEGKNYLVPVDFNVTAAYEVTDAAIDANLITGAMDEAANQLNIIILDACRDNPYPRKNRSGSRGLARMSSASGTIIAYSTGPGDVAADGEGRNSPYTAYLLKYIDTPGLTIEQVFKRVRVDVEDSTGGNQLPWETSSLRGDFYFDPALPTTPQPNIAKINPPENVAKTVSVAQPVQQIEIGSNSATAKKLSIFTNPQGSTVTLLNSGIPYSMGVKLEPGDYQVEISKDGYRTKKQWLSIDKDHLEIQITLVPDY